MFFVDRPARRALVRVRLHRRSSCASNAIYDIEEGRPIWKTLPLRVGLTVVLMVLTAVTAIGVTLSGGLAGRPGT